MKKRIIREIIKKKINKFIKINITLFTENEQRKMKLINVKSQDNDVIVGNTCYKISGGKLIEIKGIPIHSRALVFSGTNPSIICMKSLTSSFAFLPPTHSLGEKIQKKTLQ